eukprot:scaffold19451_cov56-Phaeocystis_antarctica.AAC.2
MARSTTSSGGTHSGSMGTAAAAASGAGGVYPSHEGTHDGSMGATAATAPVAGGMYHSARAMRARERQAKTSACHLYSGHD